jgi:hypothetical protein
VVVAASDSAQAVARTLAALARQRGAEQVEIIVVGAGDRIAVPVPPAPATAEAFQPSSWVTAAPGTGVPRLRRLGLDRASAPIVVFTEDSCGFGSGWAEAWVAAFRDPAVSAATGPVEAAMGEALVDWAVFFCEYAPFLGPRRRATELRLAKRLAGNNFAVRRDRNDGLDGSELHEMDVSRMLAGGDGRLIVVPAAQVGHVRHYALRQAIGDRLRFGHAYGRLRARSWSPIARLAGVFAGPAILGVQAARLTATVLARRRHLDRFLEALPLTLGLLTAWSIGEWLGWLEGSWRRGPDPLPSIARRRRGTVAPPPAQPLAPARSRPGRCTVGPPAA